TENGICASTAIFDKDGLIAAWTQWQRVVGQTDGVLGFGFNNSRADFVFLNADKKGFGSTAWGKSGNFDVYPQLTDVFEAIFPTSKGGIFKIFEFGPNTPGFQDTTALKRFSMVVAVGEKTVAIAQMNKDATADWGLGKNIFVYSGDSDVVAAVNKLAAGSAVLNPDLANIAPLTCAEVLRRKTTGGGTDGYLYVGGFHGLARLQQSDNVTDANFNNGWDSVTGLGDIADIKTFKFKKIDAWDNDLLFGIAADGNKLHIITLNKISRTENVTGDKPATQAVAVTFDKEYGSEIAVIPRWTGATQEAASVILYGTTSGLFVSIDNLVNRYQIPNLRGFPVKLVYLPIIKDAIDKSLTKGMLFVLAMDRDRDVSKVYRFVVDAAAAKAEDVLKPLDTLDDDVTLKSYIDYPDLRTDFVTDGSVFLSTRYQTEHNPNVLQIRTGGTIARGDVSLHSLLERTDANFAHMAAPVRDSWSGMLLVPGQLRVNG
ncbi:MAG: hypothetical protein V1855_01460, partial [bacterium]